MYYYTKNFENCLNYAKGYRESKGLKYLGTGMLLYGVIRTTDGEGCKLLANFGCSLNKYLAYLKKFSVSKNINNFTPEASACLNDAKKIAYEYKSGYISELHLLLAILKIDDCEAVSILKALGVDIDGLIIAISKTLEEEVRTLNEHSKNDVENDNIAENLKKNDGGANPLAPFGYDLTLKAVEQKLDPVIGRTDEINRLIQILSRKTKNNPVLVGEAGVGKTAVVEGLALKMVSGDVPDSLRNKIIFSLDLSGMIAGTKYRGDFEKRLKTAIDYVKNRKDIILFIDEIHNLVGAGSSDGAVSASEALKPILSRGEVSIIGATTIDEYTKYIEKDQALERRFQPVHVGEPTKEQAIEILTGLKPSYEAHHKVKILDEAIVAAVNLSDRYIRDRFLPDKAIDLIDEAASKKRVEVTLTPKILIEIEEKIKKLESEKSYALSHTNLDGAKKADAEILKLTSKLNEEKSKFIEKRSKNTACVTKDDVKNLISVWTKIPVNDLTQAEIDKLTNLEAQLKKRVIGQDEAIKSVVRAIKRSSAKIKDPNKPIGTFIFVGSTGVGKSELSKAIAECVFDDKDALIRFDMSEYNDKTAVNKLIGSAPGYVGYEEEGLLTEKIRKNPYSVVLFDEIEKADNEIFNLLLQVLDEGRLTDSKGREVSFKDSVIILTSNVGYEASQTKSVGFGASSITDKMKVETALKKKFNPEFINRIDEIVVFNKLSVDNCREITKLILSLLIKRVEELGVELVIDESAIDFIVEKGYDENYGARPIKRAISRYVEDMLSDAIIDKQLENGDRVTVYQYENEIRYFKD